MSVAVIDASKLKSSAVTRKIDKAIEEGETLILGFGDAKKASQDRVIRILEASTNYKRLNIVIRDAAFKEYVKNAIWGTLVGGAAGALAILIPKLIRIIWKGRPSPVSLLAVLAAMGIGAIIGGLLAVCLTPVAKLTIYRINGTQRIKIEPVS